ncbi:hypothetical protein BCR42DRAFT_3982 [Absidia repens]|uniref:Uncharacterized protein n=1 Tax=Absidia repens TaxID=90262 RepID=A0A1X2J087_9FUNG|nr:hypothetical protein BCR42DRAFT_3982 [Absidia repens]
MVLIGGNYRTEFFTRKHNINSHSFFFFSIWLVGWLIGFCGDLKIWANAVCVCVCVCVVGSCETCLADTSEPSQQFALDDRNLGVYFIHISLSRHI